MMKKNALTLLCICVFAVVSRAQVATNERFFKQAAVEFKLNADANYARAMVLAKRHNWPLSFTARNGNLAVLVGVDVFDQPKYYITNNNTIAAATTRANQLWPGGRSGLNLSGSSATLKNRIGVWDGGSVLATHQELTGRVTQKDNPSSTVDHATHVSGTMIASGVNPAAKGMAFGAQGLVAYDFNQDQVEMASEATNLVLSNHSYSIIAGWNYNSTQSRWEFNGDPNENEDYKFGYYSTDAQILDSIAYNAPFYLIVKSAGNNRDENGPAVGSPYYRKNTSGQFVNAGNRPAGISSNDSYDIISWDCGAKNILTVGAVEGIVTDYSRKEDVVMTSFSSWGPTDDGRIKPDIVADGANVLSSIATSNSSYSSFSGTSMSSPNATGSLFLVQEYYNKLKGGTNFLRSATLKGLAIHTADEAGDAVGPDYKFGWGLLNVEKAAAVITAAVPSNNASTSAHLLYENVLNQGGSFTTNVVATGNGQLQATICWTDVKGAVDVVNKLNNRAKNLVNDLDIRITRTVNGNTRTYKPWTLDVNNPSAPAVPGDNITDNVERIDVDSTVPGATYTITVTHKGTLARGSQAYSLLVSGVGGTPYCASAPATNTGSRIDSVVFRNVAIANPAGNTTYTDYTNYVADIEPAQTIPIRVKVGSSDGTNAPKMVKVFIDFNNNGTFETSELVASSSTTLSNGSVFTANITTPNTLVIGNIHLMRIVVQETSTLSDITACSSGTYTKGETEDFRVRVTSPTNDMAISSIVSPESGSCGVGTDGHYVTIGLRNNGAVTQSNIPLTLAIAGPGGAAVANLTAIYPGSITPLKTVEYTFQTPVILASGTAYTFTVTANLTGDQLSSNNQLVSVITTAAKPAAITALAGICNGAALLKVTNPDQSNYFWYTSATSNQPIALGASTSTTTIPSNNTFYVQKEAHLSVGVKDKMVYANGGYNNYTGNYVKFNNSVPITIETARLYIGNPGKITFTVGNLIEVTSTGYRYQPIDTKTLDVYATNPNPQPAPADGTGVPGNPASDTGNVFRLDLSVVPTGDHILIVECDPGGATIFRNNGITGNTYPMSIPNIMSITGNSASGQGVTESQFYYFFYDMRINTQSCISDRVAVVANTINAPTISLVNDTLVSSAASGNQWYLNDTAINGATAQKYKPTKNGSYKVVVTDALGCQKTSNAISYVLTAIDPTIAAREINLMVSPNPNNGVFNLSFEVTTKADLNIDLLSSSGQRVYNTSRPNFSGKFSSQITIPEVSSAFYVLKIQHNKKTYLQKIIIQR
ncbi:MAG: S8 family peptidase [Chitinophagaceae bacterium]|nr:S8 family peptidase [Chitinophagaceae bacterium]